MTDKDPDRAEDAEHERPPIVVVDKRISARDADAPRPVVPAESTPSSSSKTVNPQSSSEGVASSAPRPSAPAEGPAPPPTEEEGTAEEGEAGRIWTPQPTEGAVGAAAAEGREGRGEEEGREEEARRIAQQIVDVPSVEWIVNVAVTLANVAGAKLDAGHLDDAQQAIDALAGLVNAVGDRLAGAETPLRQTLAELQMVYAQRATGSVKESGGA